MRLRIPDGRQFECILLSEEDGWALRELIRPSDTPPSGCDAQTQLAKKVYEALLGMVVREIGTINVKITVQEALIINQLVKSGAWKGADAILLQTWQVLHEHATGSPLIKPIKLVLEEESSALHQESPKGAPKAKFAKRSVDCGGAELPDHEPCPGLSSD